MGCYYFSSLLFYKPAADMLSAEPDKKDDIISNYSHMFHVYLIIYGVMYILAMILI